MQDVDVKQDVARATRQLCPVWCATRHGFHAGEEDWVHTSQPLSLDDHTVANLCMSIDPTTGAQDGPFVMIGSAEYSLDQAGRIGAALIGLADLGAVPR
jgi:hypothetical protein